LELLVGNSIKSYRLSGRQQLMVAEGDRVKAGEILYKGKIINTVFYIDSARIALLLLFLLLCYFVWKANKRPSDYYEFEQLKL
jgi:hypothetical protein